jgi:geranylgeranyl pyrophosphate synthase
MPKRGSTIAGSRSKGTGRRGTDTVTAPSIVPRRDLELLRRSYGRAIDLAPSIEPHLRGAIAAALARPGSMIRAQLAFAVFSSRGGSRSRARDLAIAIECFHTASLLFDDLPCMDDAVERRDAPCVHRLWGEGTAILAALAFVNQGFFLLGRVLERESARMRAAASRLVAEALGTTGLLGGQARDLHFPALGAGAHDVLAVAEDKTVSLVRLALVLPAIASGGSRAERRRMERLARAWGLAYQIADDLRDGLLTRAETGKTTGLDCRRGRPSYLVAAGARRALDALASQLAQARDLLARPGRHAPPVPALGALQLLLEEQCALLRRRAAAAACA